MNIKKGEIKMSIGHIQRSKAFRFIALLLIFNFILFQNTTFAETQIQFRQEAGQYQSVKPVGAENTQPQPKVKPDILPNPIDFLQNDSPLSHPTPELKNESYLEKLYLNLLLSFCSINATAL